MQRLGPRIKLTAVMAGAALAAGSGFAFLEAAPSSSATAEASASPVPATTQHAAPAPRSAGPISASSVAAFPVLARSTQPGDALPSALEASGSYGAAAAFNIDPAQSRSVVAPDGTQMWLVPGASGMCLELQTGQGVCGPNAADYRLGMLVTVVPIHGPQTVEGIVPATAQVQVLSAGPAATRRAHAARSTHAHAISISSAHAAGYVIKTPGHRPYRMTFQAQYPGVSAGSSVTVGP